MSEGSDGTSLLMASHFKNSSFSSEVFLSPLAFKRYLFFIGGPFQPMSQGSDGAPLLRVLRVPLFSSEDCLSQ
jgi:hypothetical protein